MIICGLLFREFSEKPCGSGGGFLFLDSPAKRAREKYGRFFFLRAGALRISHPASAGICFSHGMEIPVLVARELVHAVYLAHEEPGVILIQGGEKPVIYMATWACRHGKHLNNISFSGELFIVPLCFKIRQPGTPERMKILKQGRTWRTLALLAGASKGPT
jgi:hypothetical protein